MATINVRASNFYDASSTSLGSGKRVFVVDDNIISQNDLLLGLYNRGVTFLNTLENDCMYLGTTTLSKNNSIFSTLLNISTLGTYNVYIVVLDSDTISNTTKIFITTSTNCPLTESSSGASVTHVVTSTSKLEPYSPTTTFVDNHWYTLGSVPTTGVTFTYTSSNPNYPSGTQTFDNFRALSDFMEGTIGYEYLQTAKISGKSNYNSDYLESLFWEYPSLTIVDVNELDLSNITNAKYMFDGSSNLKKIICDKDWETEYSSLDGEYMFRGCTSLVGAVPYDNTKQGINMANPTTGYFTSSKPPEPTTKPIYFNGTELEHVYFNGNEIEHLYFNGNQIF